MIPAFDTVKAGGQSDLLNGLFAADSRNTGGRTASDMIRANYASALSLYSYAAILSSLGRRIQNGQNVTAPSGAGAFAVIPFPQFSGAVSTIDPSDFSTYNGLVLQVQQRFRNGVYFQFSHTFSKSLSTRDFNPTFTVYGTANSQSASSTPFDLYNRKLNYGPPPPTSRTRHRSDRPP